MFLPLRDERAERLTGTYTPVHQPRREYAHEVDKDNGGCTDNREINYIEVVMIHCYPLSRALSSDTSRIVSPRASTGNRK